MEIELQFCKELRTNKFWWTCYEWILMVVLTQANPCLKSTELPGWKNWIDCLLALAWQPHTVFLWAQTLTWNVPQSCVRWALPVSHDFVHTVLFAPFYHVNNYSRGFVHTVLPHNFQKRVNNYSQDENVWNVWIIIHKMKTCEKFNAQKAWARSRMVKTVRIITHVILFTQFTTWISQLV